MNLRFGLLFYKSFLLSFDILLCLIIIFFATVGICICVLQSFERISISHFFFPLFPRFLYIYILNISVDSHACVWMCFSGLTGKEREFEDVRAAAVGAAEFEQTGRTRKEIESKSSIFF